MGSGWSISAIEGDHLDRMDSVLRLLGQSQVGTTSESNSWTDAKVFLLSRTSPTNTVPVVACVTGKWTVLADESDQLFHAIFLGKAGKILSRHFGTRVFAGFVQNTTETYGYRLFDGEELRSVWIKGKSIEAFGVEFPGEPPVRDSFDGESMVELARVLGFDPEAGVEQAKRYVLLSVLPTGSTQTWDITERIISWVVEKPRLARAVQRVLDWLEERVHP